MTAKRSNHTFDVKVDIPEENENEVGAEETEEQVYVVENPSLDLEVVLVSIEVPFSHCFLDPGHSQCLHWTGEAVQVAVHCRALSVLQGGGSQTCYWVSNKQEVW